MTMNVDLLVEILLIIGAVNGKFKEVFAKIAPLHAKNAFSLAIVIGDLFTSQEAWSEEDEAATQDLLEGNISIPLQTNFMLGRHALPQQVIERLKQADGELCENLFFLGKRTTFKTSEGIRIVALGGTLDPDLNAASSKDEYTPFYNAGDANALRGAHSADLLLTTDWPRDIEKGSKASIDENLGERRRANHVVADLCASLKPRYQFSASSAKFFEREPFFHPPTASGDSEGGNTITRFISIAPFGNTDRQKWIYAFSLDSSAASSASTVIPAGATASPLTPASAARKRLASQEEAFSRFSIDTSHQQRPHKRRHRAPPPGPSECFFCLSNPNLATQLVTSIGEDAYLTTAKGPLTTKTTFSNIPFPAHMLIVPLPHTPTLGSIVDPEVRTATYSEMKKYRSALNSMLRSASKGSLGSVSWEVSRQDGVHTHWQFLPVQRDLVQRGLVEAAFKVEAENEKYPAIEVAKHSSKNWRMIEDELSRSDFFRVWIWSSDATEAGDGDADATEAGDGDADANEGKDTILNLPLDSSFRFDFQFGRRVMSKLLSLENRLSWRECGQSEAEEGADADSFKEAFKKFDFTLV